MLRHRSVATKICRWMSRMQTHKRWATCVQAALTETGWLLPNLRRAKRSRYARPGQQGSFDERSYKLATLTVESFGCLGKEDSDLIDLVY